MKISNRQSIILWLFVACGSLLVAGNIDKYDGNFSWFFRPSAAGNLVKVDLTGKFYDGGNSVGNVVFEPAGTLVLGTGATIWDDMRIIPSGMDRPGTADPALVQMKAGVYSWEFQKNDEAYFTVQIPHGYKVGSNMYVHIHWSPGANGNEEINNTVGWKVDYVITAINGAIGNMATADLSDAVTGTDYQHEMTPEVSVSGAGAGISSIIIGRIYRTDTGTDDTWAGTATGALPFLLELDFHYEMDTIGSRSHSSK